MKLWKWLKVKLGLDFYIKEVPMRLSHKGFPPENIKWNTAFNTADNIEYAFGEVRYMAIQVAPKICPECKANIVSKGHDWWDIEDPGQYMVWTYHCPNGHGYCVEVA